MPEPTVVEEAVVETPSHEPAPAVVEDDPTTGTPEDKKGDEATPPTPTEEDLLEEIEKGEDGRFFLKAGDSTYFGSTKKEVMQNLLKGKIEQDGIIRKAKAEQVVRIPEGTRPGEETEPVFQLPDDADVYNTHLTAELRKAGIDAKMLTYTDADWIRLEDEQGLKSWQITRMQSQVANVIQRANQLADRDMAIASVAVDNNQTLEQSTKNVRKMIAKSGINIDLYTTDMFKAAIDSALAERDKSGRIPKGAIETEVAEQISKILRSNTPVKRDLAAEAARQKGRIKTPGGGGQQVEEDLKIAPSFDALTREVKGLIRAKSGREI